MALLYLTEIRDTMKHILLTATALIMSALTAAAGPLTPTGDTEDYVAFVLQSAHLGNDNSLNDNTPGLTYGRRYKLHADGVEGFVEGGVFYNSYEEVAPILIGGYSTRAAQIGKGEMRVGGFAGIGYYKKLGQKLNEKHGLPYFEGFIPIVGLTASYRQGAHELRLTTVPAGGELDAIFNLSYAFAF
jgi:hypothetical protein